MERGPCDDELVREGPVHKRIREQYTAQIKQTIRVIRQIVRRSDYCGAVNRSVGTVDNKAELRSNNACVGFGADDKPDRRAWNDHCGQAVDCVRD